MQPKSKSASQGEANLYNIGNSTAYVEPWWKSAGYKSISHALMRGNVSDSSSLEQSADGQSHSEGGLNEEDEDTGKQSKDNTDEISPKTFSLQTGSDRNYRLGEANLQQDGPILQARPDENLMQPAQVEFVSHPIACAANPYDPYYGGMMAAYGQPMVPPLFDMHQVRMPLPLEVAQEPVYVNAKQYHGILRRRQSRAKATLEKKLITSRKPYLHESRHQHAMRRARGTGGRFAKKSDADTPLKATGSGSTASSQSSGPTMRETQDLFNSDISNYRQKTNLQEPVYHSHSSTNGEGLASGTQWGNISTNHALAMQ